MDEKGICPNCEQTSDSYGGLCPENVCKRKGYHFIPFSQYERFRIKASEIGINEDTMLGRKIDKYLIVNIIGRGGMGSVYLAYQMPIQQEVALKVISGIDADSINIKRFEREARTITMVDHPNVVKLYDFGFDKNYLKMPYMVLELVKNSVTLADYIEELQNKGIKPNINEIKEIFNQILSALYTAHQAKLVHRDIKPENIMLKRLDDGSVFVKLLDFGLAKAVEGLRGNDNITQTGMIMGTVQYMAPEQFHFGGTKYADYRVDLYAVGVMLYEIFFGVEPFNGRTWKEIVSFKMNPDYSIFNAAKGRRVPLPLEQFLNKAMHRDAEQRFSSGLEMMEVFNSMIKELEDVRTRETLLNVDFVYLENINKKSLQQKHTEISEPLQKPEQKKIETSVGPEVEESRETEKKSDVKKNSDLKKDEIVSQQNRAQVKKINTGKKAIYLSTILIVIIAIIGFVFFKNTEKTNHISQKQIAIRKNNKNENKIKKATQKQVKKDIKITEAVIQKHEKKAVIANKVQENEIKNKKEKIKIANTTDKDKNPKKITIKAKTTKKPLLHSKKKKEKKKLKKIVKKPKHKPIFVKINVKPAQAFIFVNGKKSGAGTVSLDSEKCKKTGCIITASYKGYKSATKNIAKDSSKNINLILEKINPPSVLTKKKQAKKDKDNQKKWEAMVKTAENYCKKGKIPECSVSMKKAKQLMPDNPKNAVLDKIIILYKKKRDERAVLISKAGVAMKQNKFKQAIKFLKQAEKKIPADSDTNAKINDFINHIKSKL